MIRKIVFGYMRELRATGTFPHSRCRGTGALIGVALVKLIAHRRRQGLNTQSARGELILLVRTRTADLDRQAKDILLRHAARHVRSRDLLPHS